jgi:hypothetical protein
MKRTLHQILLVIVNGSTACCRFDGLNDASPLFLSQRLIWRVLKSCSAPQATLRRGRGCVSPTLLVPSILVNVSFLQGFVSFTLHRCPGHLGLPASTSTPIMSGSTYTWQNSWFYIIRDLPFSLMGPYIFLSIFLSNILSPGLTAFILFMLSCVGSGLATG